MIEMEFEVTRMKKTSPIQSDEYYVPNSSLESGSSGTSLEQRCWKQKTPPDEIVSSNYFSKPTSNNKKPQTAVMSDSSQDLEQSYDIYHGPFHQGKRSNGVKICPQHVRKHDQNPYSPSYRSVVSQTTPQSQALGLKVCHKSNAISPTSLPKLPQNGSSVESREEESSSKTVSVRKLVNINHFGKRAHERDITNVFSSHHNNSKCSGTYSQIGISRETNLQNLQTRASAFSLQQTKKCQTRSSRSPSSFHNVSSFRCTKSHTTSFSRQTNNQTKFSPHGTVARSSPEALKTLLRKKACIYEPVTSHAIALITWHVGKDLTLRQGHFSRQQLQANVHFVVADKIRKGLITRTKVNRCMQIILNSCFHYIIPKPDGSIDNGNSISQNFRRYIEDDTYMVKSLPTPWHDLDIDINIDIDNDGINDSFDYSTCANVGTIKTDEDFGKRHSIRLCFNENVRSAEDVLYCHNEFIRDVAASGNLLMSAHDWKIFFAISNDDDESCTTDVTAELTVTSGGGYSFHNLKSGDTELSHISLEIPKDVADFLTVQNELQEFHKSNDLFGRMKSSELNRFRSTWCCKRYDHNHSLCRFAHVDINKGWLRRNPFTFEYSHEMCPDVKLVNDKKSVLNGCFLNTCKEGVFCKSAHSTEEIDYHPDQYKSCVCKNECNKSMFSCKLKDICPKFHPENDGYRSSLGGSKPFPLNSTKKVVETFLSRTGLHDATMRKTNCISNASGAPMLYLNPSPRSQFDENLILPGLKSLYRHNCASHFLKHTDQQEYQYNIF